MWDFDGLSDSLSSVNKLLDTANTTVDGVQALQTNVAGTPAIVPAAAPVADSAAKNQTTDEELTPPDSGFLGNLKSMTGLPVWSILTIAGGIVLLVVALILKKVMK